MKIKKAVFITLCLIITGLIVYTAISGAGSARNLSEYQQALSDIENGTPEQVIGALYYNKLSCRLQYIYNAICKAIDEKEEYTGVIPFLLTQTELDTAVDAVFYDKPEYFYIDPSAFTLEDYTYEKETKKAGDTIETATVRVYRDNKYSVLRIPYTVDDEEISTLKTRLNAALAKADIKAKDVQDSYLQVRLIHDYMTDICSHYIKTEGKNEISPFVSTAYGALVEGEADSRGYAKAFKLLWARYGGISHTVNGLSAEGSSAWNVALVNDKYYNIDVYLDDLDSTVNGETVHGVSSHLWLCRNDEVFYKGHSQKPEGIPACTDVCDYYTRNSLIAANVAELEAVISAQIKTCAESRSYCFEICYTGEDAENEISAQTFSVLTSADSEYSGFADSCTVYRTFKEENVYIVYMYVKTETQENG